VEYGTANFYLRTVHNLLGGVDLFFVLSGFLIGGVLLDRRTRPNYFKIFWIRRAARILPVAYVLLASYVIALGISQTYDIKWMNITCSPSRDHRFGRSLHSPKVFF
jgi:peptidoglycan/LPS O-acetylase OafA/YrhL